MRIDSHEHEPTGSSDSGKGDDIEMRNNDKTQEAATGLRHFPASSALNDEGASSSDEAPGDGAFQFYKVYKRRWFGLVQLTLLNIIVSWDVSIQSFLFRLGKYAPFFRMGIFVSDCAPDVLAMILLCLCASSMAPAERA